MTLDEIYRTMKITNSRLNTLRLLTGDASVVTMPQSIGFQNTCFCNLRCPHCQTHGVDDIRTVHNTITMPEEMLRRVAAEVLPTAGDYLFTVSGEPLAAPHFTELLEEFLLYGAKLLIHTNATLFNQEVLSALIPASQRIYLSIDAASEFATGLLRKGTHYRKLLHNIRLLTRAVELLPEALRPDILFWCTVMGSNIRELPEIVKLASAMGVKKVHGHFVSIFYDHLKSEAIEHHKPLYNAYYEEARRVALDLGMELWLPPVFEGVIGDAGGSVGGEYMIIEEFPADYTETLRQPKVLESLVDVQAIQKSAEHIRDTIMKKMQRTKRDERGGRLMGAIRSLWTPTEKTGELKRLKAMETYLARLLKAHTPHLEHLIKDGNKTVRYCESLYQRCYLSPLGGVTPCCYIYDVMGNVNENTVETIWNNKVYQDLRDRFQSSNPPQECVNCHLLSYLPQEMLLQQLEDLSRR